MSLLAIDKATTCREEDDHAPGRQVSGIEDERHLVVYNWRSNTTNSRPKAPEMQFNIPMKDLATSCPLLNVKALEADTEVENEEESKSDR